MYRVVEFFTDLQDDDYAYSVGDVFPRDGLTVSAKRLAELSSGQNIRGVALIREVENDEVAKEAKLDTKQKKGKKKPLKR